MQEIIVVLVKNIMDNFQKSLLLQGQMCSFILMNLYFCIIKYIFLCNHISDFSFILYN